MVKRIFLFILGILIIQFSASLGYATLNFVYINKNLAEEYSLLLNGYIYSYMLIGLYGDIICLSSLIPDIMLENFYHISQHLYPFHCLYFP